MKADSQDARTAPANEVARAFGLAKLADAEGLAQHYQMWRRYLPTAENDAARKRYEDALDEARLILGLLDAPVH